MAGLKRDKYDAVTSDLVRNRNDFTCENCGKVDPDGQASGKSNKMDCSHYYGRRHQSTRYCLKNCACLCKGCHRKFTENPGDYADWMLNKLGDEEIESLRIKHHAICKRTKAEKEEIHKHYLACIGYVRKRRDKGHIGYIDVPEYE